MQKTVKVIFDETCFTGMLLSNLKIFNLHISLYAYLYRGDFEKDLQYQLLQEDSFPSSTSHKKEYFCEIEYMHHGSIQGFRGDILLLLIINLHLHSDTQHIIG